MNYNFIILGAVLIPIVGSIFLPAAGWFSPKTRNLLAFIFILCSFLFSLSLLPIVLSGQTITISKHFSIGFNFSFTADNLAVFMAIASSMISAIIVLYSFGYISHYENQNEYYSMVVLFCGSMMGIVFSSNLILMYIFWEITGITSWRLIGFFREKQYVLKADKAFLITAFGAVAMLLGFIIIYQQYGSFDFSVLKTKAIPNIVVLLILLGIFSKSATLPFHTWLPDAGIAPSPVTALLHAAVLVKIGVYAFARLFIATFSISDIWHTIVPVIAGASAIISAGAALVDNDLKRIIAYSTISQIGFIFFGLSIGTEIGITGGLLYILMHGIAKAGLFLCAGIIEQNTKTKDIREMGGLIKTMPITAGAFLFCAFSVMGIPPFGGFFSKYIVFAGAIQNREFIFSFVFLAGAILTILYLLRLFNAIFMNEDHAIKPAKEGSPIMIACVAFLAVLSILGGILIYYPSVFAQLASKQMLGLI
jgi:proton-translocating NADH-quinone oxidoreductase chain N